MRLITSTENARYTCPVSIIEIDKLEGRVYENNLCKIYYCTNNQEHYLCAINRAEAQAQGCTPEEMLQVILHTAGVQGYLDTEKLFQEKSIVK